MGLFPHFTCDISPLLGNGKKDDDERMGDIIHNRGVCSHNRGGVFTVHILDTVEVYYYDAGGSRSIVVGRWTAGHQVERSILHQGHGSY